jgi:retinol dehydrogenase 12
MATTPHGAAPTILVIGATSGLGREAARLLADRGCRLLLVGRDARRGTDLVREIGSKYETSSAEFIAGDVSTRSGVDAIAGTVAARTDRIDALLNNAGVMAQRRTVTAEGFELNFAVHHLAAYSMTMALLPLLRRAGGRVVNTNSVAHQAALFTSAPVDIDFSDLQSERRYSPYLAYSVTKLANLLFTFEFHRRVRDVPIVAVHPGMVRTRLVRSMRSPGFWLLSTSTRYVLLRSAKVGGRTLAELATTADLRSGAYYDRFAPAIPSAASRDRTRARRLWTITEQLRGRYGDVPANREL